MKMCFKVLVPILVVLSVANAHPHHPRHDWGGPPPHHEFDHSSEIMANQNKMLTDVGTLIKAVKEGQMLEMTYDMWTRQQKMDKKLDTLIERTEAAIEEEKMIDEPREEEAIAEPREENLMIEPEDLVENNNGPQVDKAQPEYTDLNNNMLFK